MNDQTRSMQCITTKILPPTDTKCKRIKATCKAGSLTLSVNDPKISHINDSDMQEFRIAYLLAKSLGWLEKSELFMGVDKWGNGQHVLVEKNWLHEDLK